MELRKSESQSCSLSKFQMWLIRCYYQCGYNTCYLLVQWKPISIISCLVGVTSVCNANGLGTNTCNCWSVIRCKDFRIISRCQRGNGIFATTISNVSVTVPPLLSLAVTVIEIVPTSEFDGVPLKVRVVGLKISQVGNEAPPFNWAE